MIYILMGVSGAGKTVIGRKLADKLDIPFYDADDFHPPRNIEKMESGLPLNDRDRKPWLLKLADKIRRWENEGGAVLACSALKEHYRKLLTSRCPRDCTRFIYLKGDANLIAERLARRSDHFMPGKLLDSQFEALEEPEDALTVSIEQNPEEIIRDIMDKLDG